MFVILCKKDGDPETTIAIIKDDENEFSRVLATWDTIEEAIEFSKTNFICQKSLVLVINLDEHPVLEEYLSNE